MKVRLDGMWRDGVVKHKHANGLVGVYVQGGVETVSQEVTVLSKRCKPVNSKGNRDDVHSVHTPARMQRRFMDFLRPIVIVPPVVSLAAVLGVILTTWMSCTLSSTTSTVFRHLMKFQRGMNVVNSYVYENATCEWAGEHISMQLDFDSSGNLSIGEIPGIPGNVFIPYEKVTKIICGVERSMNGSESISKKIEDGTLTGQDVQHFVKVVYHEVLSNSVGPAKEAAITNQIVSQRNQAQEYVKGLIHNGTNMAEE